MQHIEDDERPSAKVSFPASLIVRGSTGPPRVNVEAVAG